MAKPTAPKKPRRQRKSGTIDLEKIVAAALRVAKRDGATALSMRAIAAELNISPMAAYYYVPSKKALVDLIMDKIFSAVSTAHTSGSPEERLHAMFWQSRDVLRQYPGLAVSLLSSPRQEGKELTRIHNELKELFQAAGYSARYTEAGFLLVSLFEYGAMMLEDGIATGIVDGSQYEEIESHLDDGLSLIFAGLKAFGDRERLDKQLPSKQDQVSVLRRRAPRRAQVS